MQQQNNTKQSLACWSPSLTCCCCRWPGWSGQATHTTAASCTQGDRKRKRERVCGCLKRCARLESVRDRARVWAQRRERARKEEKQKNEREGGWWLGNEVLPLSFFFVVAELHGAVGGWQLYILTSLDRLWKLAFLFSSSKNTLAYLEGCALAHDLKGPQLFLLDFAATGSFIWVEEQQRPRQLSSKQLNDRWRHLPIFFSSLNLRPRKFRLRWWRRLRRSGNSIIQQQGGNFWPVAERLFKPTATFS